MGEALTAAQIEITKIDFGKKRPVWIRGRPTALSVEALADTIREKLGKALRLHPDVFDAISDGDAALTALIEKHGEATGLTRPAALEFQDLCLNLDMSSSGRDLKFFLSNDQGYVSPVSGAVYIARNNLKVPEAVAMARPVFPEYHPRAERGVFSRKFDSGESHDIFNTYVPPTWKEHPDYVKRSGSIPPLFKRLLQHLLPDKKERGFLYGWMYCSLFSRAPTFLVLCGKGGVGKNRLKLLMRALHGHLNTTDGKESTLTEKFNNQLENSTLIWFDELIHGKGKVESKLKEMQNETLSIERKGMDTTRSTRIFASIVITNNNYRDNHRDFEARKFVPLQVTDIKLSKVWTSDEIEQFNHMVEFPDHPDFDPSALAQFAKWLQKNGPLHAAQFENMEYKGPMFYKLANTSMSRWQAVAVETLSGLERVSNRRLIFADKLGFRWSSVERHLRGNKENRLGQFEPNYSLVKGFFDSFRDLNGRKAFVTTIVPDSHTQDFYVDPILKVEPVKEIESEEGQDGKEKIDDL